MYSYFELFCVSKDAYKYDVLTYEIVRKKKRIKEKKFERNNYMSLGLKKLELSLFI